MILASASPMTLTLALSAAAAYVVSASRTSHADPRLARLPLWLAWALHGLILLLSVLSDERQFGFAPALSVTVWLAGLVYGIELYFFPQIRSPSLLCLAGAGSVILTLLFPGSVLSANTSAWLPLHWALGIASYGLFAVAVVHAWMMTRAEERIRQAKQVYTGLPLLTMERLIFRFVGVGFGLLSATLLAGFFFGTQLYGSAHAVKWDHKTAFSVLSWLTFATLLVGRVRFGWRGKRALRVLYAGSGLLLLAYVGSRFVMEVLLGRTL
jgi:ABC-type uncharacterized transport system permease subunit